jgi:chemotaxis protein MotB
MDDLAKAFNDAGITVSVDQTSGEMAMDSSILFGGDSAVLSAEGKAFLNKFINAYTSIVYNDKYNGFVAKTMVEGHTAPLANSTYESGLPLSQERAANVKAYCLSAENGISAEYITALSTTLEDIGYSNSRPIKDADGNVNKAASRRVSFRFIINLD